MKAGEILINGIFNGSRLLEVPFYQRAYVWDEEQWDRFLSDMEFVTKTKKPYFLGSIIFKSGKTPNTWDHFSDCKVIIDGQQRLTTLVIFFKALCLKKTRIAYLKEISAKRTTPLCCNMEKMILLLLKRLCVRIK